MKLILVGGFLGSGKTTAIVQACQYLMKKGKKVGVITNDQGDQQVDSAYVSGLGIQTKEVSNGCFCCRYDELNVHLQTLETAYQPDVVFAESVGSCTDLVAAVAKPLLQFKPGIDLVISVFADAAMLVGWIEGRTSFLEESVRYIYKKQLEEADVIVINKSDIVTSDQMARIDRAIHAEYGNKTIVHQNSLIRKDVVDWINILDRHVVDSRNSLALDYTIYGDGEAKMAWLDIRLTIDAPLGNGTFIVQHFIRSVFLELQRAQLTIGHLKFYIDSDNWSQKISFTAANTSAGLRLHVKNLKHVRMLVNARVQSDPETLRQLVNVAIADVQHLGNCAIHIEQQSAFKPGFPKPTHRII